MLKLNFATRWQSLLRLNKLAGVMVRGIFLFNYKKYHFKSQNISDVDILKHVVPEKRKYLHIKKKLETCKMGIYRRIVWTIWPTSQFMFKHNPELLFFFFYYPY